MEKKRWDLFEAGEIARKVQSKLKPCCQRIEIAGSIRRGKSTVGDIEICAIPKYTVTLDMFGGVADTTSQLDLIDFREIGNVIKGGSRYKQILLPEGIALDLFIIQPPNQWGLLFTLRTGDADFSHAAVTSKRYGGLLPSNCRIKDGSVWNGLTKIETPEEKDFLAILDLEELPPSERTNFDRKAWLK
jgi:DNA polymerase/3'-5' exonuclease PolX